MNLKFLRKPAGRMDERASGGARPLGEDSRGHKPISLAGKEYEVFFIDDKSRADGTQFKAMFKSNGRKPASVNATFNENGSRIGLAFSDEVRRIELALEGNRVSMKYSVPGRVYEVAEGDSGEKKVTVFVLGRKAAEARINGDGKAVWTTGSGEARENELLSRALQSYALEKKDSVPMLFDVRRLAGSREFADWAKLAVPVDVKPKNEGIGFEGARDALMTIAGQPAKGRAPKAAAGEEAAAELAKSGLGRSEAVGGAGLARLREKLRAASSGRLTEGEGVVERVFKVDGKKVSVKGRAHANGGGFVALTAKVADTAYVGKDAAVLEYAEASGYSRIEGKAIVRGHAHVSDCAWVMGDAVASGHSKISGYARVYGDARIYGWAHVGGNAKAYGNADIRGHASIFEEATVYGEASVYGEAVIRGHSKAYGASRVSGKAVISGFAWVYGDAEVTGDALVFGNSRVYGSADVRGQAHVFGGAHAHGYVQLSGETRLGGSAEAAGSSKFSGAAHAEEGEFLSGKFESEEGVSDYLEAREPMKKPAKKK